MLSCWVPPCLPPSPAEGGPPPRSGLPWAKVTMAAAEINKTLCELCGCSANTQRRSWQKLLFHCFLWDIDIYGPVLVRIKALPFSLSLSKPPRSFCCHPEKPLAALPSSCAADANLSPWLSDFRSPGESRGPGAHLEAREGPDQPDRAAAAEDPGAAERAAGG